MPSDAALRIAVGSPLAMSDINADTVADNCGVHGIPGTSSLTRL